MSRITRTVATDPGLRQLACLNVLRCDVDAAVTARTDELLGAGYSYAEVADALGTTRQAVRQAHQRRAAAPAHGTGR